VASASAKLGLPEVKLAPAGAGGTVRLRGWSGSSGDQMIVSGEPVPASALAGTRLLDRVVEGDPPAAAVELATSPEVATKPPPRTRDLPLDEPNLAALCHAARARLKPERPPLPAPPRIIEVIETGAGMPFDEALALERQAFVERWRPRSRRASATPLRRSAPPAKWTASGRRPRCACSTGPP
jgi:enoyl-CoA hydratase/carnithine racemase